MAPVAPPAATGEKPARAPASMAALPASGWRWRVLGQVEMPMGVTPYIPTPLSKPLHLRSQQDSTSGEGLVGTVKRGREGTPCPHFTLPPVWAEGRMELRFSPSFLSIRVGHPGLKQVELLVLLGSASCIIVCVLEPWCGKCLLVLLRETEAWVNVGPAL